MILAEKLKTDLSMVSLNIYNPSWKYLENSLQFRYL